MKNTIRVVAIQPRVAANGVKYAEDISFVLSPGAESPAKSVHLSMHINRPEEFDKFKTNQEYELIISEKYPGAGVGIGAPIQPQPETSAS